MRVKIPNLLTFFIPSLYILYFAIHDSSLLYVTVNINLIKLKCIYIKAYLEGDKDGDLDLDHDLAGDREYDLDGEREYDLDLLLRSLPILSSSV